MKKCIVFLFSAMTLLCHAEGNGCSQVPTQGLRSSHQAPDGWVTHGYLNAPPANYTNFAPKKKKEPNPAKKAPISRKNDSIYVAQNDGTGFTVVSCKHLNDPAKLTIRNKDNKALIDTTFVGTFVYNKPIANGTYYIEINTNGTKEFRRLIVKK